MEKLKVFLSSAMTELHNERVAAHNALTGRDVEVIWFEGFGARPETAQTAYLEGVQGADVYIGIFWNQHSPAVEEEYREALRLGKDCLIYVKDFDVHRDRALMQLLAEIRERHVYKTFQNTIELADHVQRDVQTWLIRQVRQTKKELLSAEKRWAQGASEAEQQVEMLKAQLARLRQSLTQPERVLLDKKEEVLGELQTLRAKVFEILIEADRSRDAGLAKERFDRLEVKIQKFLRETVSTAEADRLYCKLHPRGGRRRLADPIADLERRSIRPCLSYLEALIEAIEAEDIDLIFTAEE
jgi:hypothetical protein